MFCKVATGLDQILPKKLRTLPDHAPSDDMFCDSFRKSPRGLGPIEVFCEPPDDVFRDSVCRSAPRLCLDLFRNLVADIFCELATGLDPNLPKKLRTLPDHAPEPSDDMFCDSFCKTPRGLGPIELFCASSDDAFSDSDCNSAPRLC